MTEPFKNSAAFIVQSQPELAAEIVALMKAKNPPMTSMTIRQCDALNFIRKFAAENNGICPSYREIGIAMGLAGIGGVHRLVTGLEERGFIRRLPNRSRAIVVIEQVAA